MWQPLKSVAYAPLYCWCIQLSSDDAANMRWVSRGCPCQLSTFGFGSFGMLWAWNQKHSTSKILTYILAASCTCWTTVEECWTDQLGASGFAVFIQCQRIWLDAFALVHLWILLLQATWLKLILDGQHFNCIIRSSDQTDFGQPIRSTQEVE